MLVPITGTDVSRRAAELAFSIAKKGTVTAIYVGQSKRNNTTDKVANRRQARNVAKNIGEIAFSIWCENRDPHRVGGQSRQCNSRGIENGWVRSYRYGREPPTRGETVLWGYGL